MPNGGYFIIFESETVEPERFFHIFVLAAAKVGLLP